MGCMHQQPLPSLQPKPVITSTVLEVTIPGIRLQSLNQSFRGASRGARMGAVAKIRKQREQVAMALHCLFGQACSLSLPVVVTVTRIAPGKLDAHDNLPASAKAVVDAIAEWIGTSDRNPGIAWKYAQKRDGRNYGIVIRVEKVA